MKMIKRVSLLGNGFSVGCISYYNRFVDCSEDFGSCLVLSSSRENDYIGQSCHSQNVFLSNDFRRFYGSRKWED